MLPLLLRAKEVAEVLGLDVQTVYLMGQQGRLKRVRIGKQAVRFPRAEVMKVLRRGLK